MKKIIGILGVAVIAATMFFSANNVAGSGSDASLAGLIGMNTANAEDPDDAGVLKSSIPTACTRIVEDISSGYFSYPHNRWIYNYIEVPGTKIDCVGIGSGCFSTHCI